MLFKFSSFLKPRLTFLVFLIYQLFSKVYESSFHVTIKHITVSQKVIPTFPKKVVSFCILRLKEVRKKWNLTHKHMDMNIVGLVAE